MLIFKNVDIFENMGKKRFSKWYQNNVLFFEMLIFFDIWVKKETLKKLLFLECRYFRKYCQKTKLSHLCSKHNFFHSIYSFGTNTRNRTRPRTFSKLLFITYKYFLTVLSIWKKIVSRRGIWTYGHRCVRPMLYLLHHGIWII